MSRCKHPSAKLVFESFFAPSADSSFTFAARTSPKIQIFQCPHCHAVQMHIIRDSRVEVRAWSRHPFTLPGGDSGLAGASGPFMPPATPAGADILPFLAPPPARPNLRATVPGSPR